MKKFIFLFILPLLLLSSCENDAGTEVTEYMPNFIDAYYSYDDCVIYVYDSYQFRICADFEINRVKFRDIFYSQNEIRNYL